MTTFGQQIRQFRNAQNLSLREAGEQIPIDFAVLSRIERGSVPCIGNFAKLCRWARISFDDGLAGLGLK